MKRGWMDVGVVAGLALLLVVSPAAAVSRKDSIDRLAAKYHELKQFNGALLVADEKGIILKKGYGPANFEWQIPVTPDTKFRIGSVTKQFTAAVILQLVNEGKVGLEDPITKHLTDYRQDTGARVTVTHLLNHTSGIPSYTSRPDFGEKVSRNPYKVTDFVKQFASGDLEFEPGSKYSYNNSGYFLLGAIIEKVTGKPYAQVLRERIFEPVGMKNTGYDVSSTILAKRASGYERNPDGYVNAAYLDMGLPYAAGSMYSTVEDLYLWDRALYGDKVLPAALKQKMFTPGLDDYGFGWNVAPTQLDDGKTKVATTSHGGGINGFSSFLIRVPEKKEVVIVLSNVGRGVRAQSLAVGVLSALYGVTPQTPLKPISEVVSASLAKGTATEAITQYKALKEKKPTEYFFGAGELNRVGYQLLQGGRVPEAIEIFKLNVDQFPQDGNVHDSLGEAYIAHGDKALAASSYRRSLELDPTNTNAEKVLKEIEKPAAKTP
ncbi:serine hydrolase [Myxococcus llanfairpwllgwyngyllgogerychwyrndrobwllllantysiliogogogochensis]|uniref:Serine hydrolase n=1 Tax=Myxococcus llanfairpwllgwyngyllgogerychwyrndrobwllllantysiliogogogochensis TaxID=2590453 RepID=A0A540X2Y1_9BACT|nr:serine hydrolase domain-containing protein [Myxococcus llanfairpwllgwyngyllgogerychwyrndrobwllllantysiliogogogochensis]TQF15044.1 serine hydrolase [Myxococcus llanfairpwllgwyngyllgogerychwyrndrobwllllantysiliogogogochensis]